jgi:formylglycine-generating enzyme required for sulfatase activity
MARFVPALAASALLAGALGVEVGAPLLAQTPQAPGRAVATTLQPALTPGEGFADCEECPEVVVVPAGTFTMGSPESEPGRNSWEGPPHTVTIERPFAVGKFEVTVQQFTAFVRETGYRAEGLCWALEDGRITSRPDRSWRNPGYTQDGSYPAVCLSWSDAKACVDWLAKRTGKPYRLLSEAEWEYAARAMTKAGVGPRYGFGNDEAAICAYGNGFDQTAKRAVAGTRSWPALSCSDSYAQAAPVGKFPANAFGLHDMVGNAKEWTADCYQLGHDYRGAPVNGSPWMAGDCRQPVLRGGSWLGDARMLRVAFRYKAPTDERLGDVGLRVALSLAAP